jgi:hypothetical protein
MLLVPNSGDIDDAILNIVEDAVLINTEFPGTQFVRFKRFSPVGFEQRIVG